MPALSEAKKVQLFQFLRRRPLAVVATAGPRGEPQAALMNVAALPDLSLVFETTSVTRKAANIERDPRVALVVGWDGPETLQIEGLAERAEGRRLDAARDAFIAAFPAKSPDEHWPGNGYFIVTPAWLRFSSYYRPRFTEEYRLAGPPAPRVSRWRAWLERMTG